MNKLSKDVSRIKLLVNKEAYDFEVSLAAGVLDFLVALDNAVDTDIVEADQAVDFVEQH